MECEQVNCWDELKGTTKKKQRKSKDSREKYNC